jgi:peptide/nickel transport system permease protein
MAVTVQSERNPDEKVYQSPSGANRDSLLRRILTNRSSAIGLLTVLVIVALALLAPVLAPYDPQSMDMANRLSGPSPAHLLGTDKFGRDTLSRIIWGAQVSLLVGVVAVLIGSMIGSLLGLLAGYIKGGTDNLVMRLMDIMLSLPTEVLALAMVAVLGQSLINVMIAVGIPMIPSFARVMRSSVLLETEKDYVLGEYAIGARHPRILFRHILPNTLSSVLVLATLRVATAILVESSLSFLGLGVEFERPTWGNMINEGRAYLEMAPWASIFPGLAIMLTVIGFSLLGDGLREVYDPRLRR